MSNPHRHLMRRSVALTALVGGCLLFASTPAGVGAASTTGFSIRVTQPAPPSNIRFLGSVRFSAPSAWRQERPWSLGSANFEVNLSSGCEAMVYISAASALTPRDAREQLERELRKASQPGKPVPHPVGVIAQGPLAGEGWWETVEPRPTPERGGQAFPVFGASLIGSGDGRWAGLSAGIAPAASCPLRLPGEDELLTTLGQLLRSVTVHVRTERRAALQAAAR
jgi:hypothetical protein